MIEREQRTAPLATPSNVATQSGGRLASALVRDQNDHWQQGDPLPVEAYLRQYTTLRDDPEAVLDLICNEWAIREGLGEELRLDEYLERFPDYAESLRMQWEVHAVCRAAKRAVAAPTMAAQSRPTLSAPAPVLPSTSTLPDIPGYEVLGILGKGGMGVVYKARHLGLNRLVALKLPLAGHDINDAELVRFRREAEAAASLQHPHLVQIHDVGAWQAGPSGPAFPFMSMELVDGGSLHGLLRDGPLAPRDAAALIETLARAMHYAHQRGIVHRDLKPGNILLAAGGLAPDAKPRAAELVPKITDFGLAKRLDADRDQTRTGAVMGTPSYMAPEQAEGRTHDIGPAADVYALGAILYETLAGRPPFKGTTVLDTLEQVRFLEPVALRRLQPKTPRDLETICLKCLAKEARKRYASAEALADDLHRFLDGKPIIARPTPLREHVWKAARRRPGVSALVALVILVALGGLIGILTQWFRAEKSADEQRRIAYMHGINRVHQYLQGNDTGRAQDLLDSLRPRRNQTDLRGFEWHYLYGLAHGDALTLPGNECVAISPDGQLLASGGDGGTVVIWDRFGREFSRLKGHTDTVTAVAFSPDGTLLASAAKDHAMKLWDWHTGQESAVLPIEHTKPILSVAFSRDGAALASTSGDGSVVVCDVRAGKKIKAMPLGRAGVRYACAAFSSDRRVLAIAGTDENIWLWEWKTDAKPRLFEQASGGAGLALAFSPDGRLLATAGRDGAIRLWDYVAEKPLATLNGHAKQVSCLAFAPDNKRLASGSQDRTIRIWDVPTDADSPVSSPLILHGHRAMVTALGFEQGGRFLASAGMDKTVRLWDTKARRPEEQRPVSRRSQLAGIAYTPDGRYLAASSRAGSIYLWDARSRELLAEWSGHEKAAVAVAFSPDATILASASKDASIKLWDVATHQLQQTLEGHTAEVTGVAFGPDGALLASSSRDGTVRLWDRTSGQATILRGHEGVVHDVAFSPDGKRFASAGADHTVRLWAVNALSAEPLIIRGEDEIHQVAFSPDGKRLATGSKDRSVIVFDAVSGQLLFALPGHDGEVVALAFHPTDNRRLASAGSDNIVKLWDLDTRQEVLTLIGCSYNTVGLAFRPHGDELAAIGGSLMQQGQIKRWSAAPTAR